MFHRAVLVIPAGVYPRLYLLRSLLDGLLRLPSKLSKEDVPAIASAREFLIDRGWVYGECRFIGASKHRQCTDVCYLVTDAMRGRPLNGYVPIWMDLEEIHLALKHGLFTRPDQVDWAVSRYAHNTR